MTTAQYQRFLGFSQKQKSAFIALAKRKHVLSEEQIYWLELAYEVHQPAFRKSALVAVKGGK